MGGHKGGRKRKPTILHLLEGGRKKTHRLLPKNEPHPPAVIPKCPKHLDKEARKEWRRMAKELEPLGLLTNLDKAVFASYCQAWSTWIYGWEKIREKGMVVMASTGTPMLNPYYPIINKANEQMMKALIEIGMSPSSRSRVKVEPRPKKDEAEDFLKEGIGGRK
jgi:P27 family predicted phage terminase small subunit